MENDIPSETNENRVGKEVDGFLLRPVSPSSSGEGLPYAPIDWPNPGDNWSWKVGRRISSSGYYCDRYLYLPSGLQKPRRKKEYFPSKPSLEHYIQTNFPAADVNAFWASFSWKVPSKKQYWTKGKAIAEPSEVASQVEEEKVKNGRKMEKAPGKRKSKPAALSSIYKRRTRQSWKQLVPFSAINSGIVIDLSSPTRETTSGDSTTNDLKSTTDFESNQVSSRSITISPAQSSVATCHSPVIHSEHVMDPPQESLAEAIPEDFDEYINSLENILAQPLFEDLLPAPATNVSPSPEELAEARRKLSSLLAMDFPSLISSQNLTELSALSSKIQKDPGLSADQLSKLKLVEEIPLLGEDFLEAKKVIEHANKFFAGLKANIAKATWLRKEYNESKERAALIQEELDSSSLAMQEIDNQIAQLQCKRAELACAVEIQKKATTELTSTRIMVADTLPKVVHEIQLANSKREEWEQKKENSAKDEAEILAKFSPLKGFSL